MTGHHRTRRPLIAAVAAPLGVAAVFGGWNLLADAEGFGLETAWLEGTPFRDYTIPGAVLGALGAGLLATAALAARGNRLAAPAAVGTGAATLGFVAVETLAIGYRGDRQVPLVATVAGASLLLVAAGRRALRHP